MLVYYTLSMFHTFIENESQVKKDIIKFTILWVFPCTLKEYLQAMVEFWYLFLWFHADMFHICHDTQILIINYKGTIYLDVKVMTIITIIRHNLQAAGLASSCIDQFGGNNDHWVRGGGWTFWTQGDIPSLIILHCTISICICISHN